jgi:hypothetical protein
VRIRLLAESRGWSRIGEAEWEALRAEIPGATTEDLLRSGVASDPPWRAVRQHDFEELALDLTSLADLYEARPDLRKRCRAEVIRAKDRARAVSRSPHVAEATRTRKEAMVEAMLVWLGDPALFGTWIGIRLSARGREGQEQERP